MKKLGYILISLLITTGLAAQTSDLTIHSENGKLYLNHTVEAKENWYSIGRLYNISPREIAPLNGLTLNSGLEIGQQLKIPLTKTNFAQLGVAPADEVFVPLYHTVEQKEGLFRIGQHFNKVPAANLKKWNNLSAESISVGQQLVVGFLKVKKNQSALAANGIRRIGDPIKTAPPLVKTEATEPPATTEPSKPAAVSASTAPPQQNAADINTAKASPEGSGFFKNLYKQQALSNSAFRSEMGSASIFKSTSGWQDAKYYVLMNNISPGTIVRITNPVNSRIIFAKVLGELPPGKENDGLLIRISNAAAAELKINEKDSKFPTEVSYAKS